jgi:hypothetical protein
MLRQQAKRLPAPLLRLRDGTGDPQTAGKVPIA